MGRGGTLVLALFATFAAGGALGRDRVPARQPAPAAQAQPAQTPQPGPETAVANDVRLAGDGARTRFILDLDRPVEMAVSAMADPYRIIVDTPEIAFRLAANAGRDGRGIVSAFRYGRFAPGRSRIVLDVREPARVERSFVLPPGDGQPARLVIDLVRSSRDEFLRAIERDAGPRGDRPSVRQASLSSGRANDPATARAALPLVVLDPGHGGIDAGAQTADGQPEKAIVLEFALALRDVLERTGRVRVALTREDDTFIRLDERVAFGRERQAALFLSLHADSLARSPFGVSGASVYTLSDRASDRDAAAYAERENRADLISGAEVPPANDEVADILFDLMHRETKSFSLHFARLLVDELRPQMRLVRNPHRSAGFRVLRAADVPSALLELGYLSSREDAALLTSARWREQTAQVIARAILSFIDSSRARPPTAERTP